MKTFKQFYENSLDYHYTLVGIGGDHSEAMVIKKSFGHVPEQKVPKLVEYLVQELNDEWWEDEDFQGAYEDYQQVGSWEAMNDLYQELGIDEAVGEYHTHEQYRLVKHVPPHQPVQVGKQNF